MGFEVFNEENVMATMVKALSLLQTESKVLYYLNTAAQAGEDIAEFTCTLNRLTTWSAI